MSDSNDIVFSPSEISSLTIEYIKEEQKHPDFLKTGIEQLDNHYVMRRPHRVNGVLAATSHGKTSLCNILARNDLTQLREGEIVVWCTWEDSIEDFGMNGVANFSRIPVASLFHGEVKESDWKRMMKAASDRAAQPLWAIGHSEQRGAKRPRLTMTDIAEALTYIADVQGKKIRSIYFDYLQRINRKDTGTSDIRGGFVEIMDRVKDLSIQFNSCVTIGSQVKREVNERKWRQPKISDAQESSNFEHTCDAIISLWIPYKSSDVWHVGEQLLERQGEMDVPIVVTKSLMTLETLKQKRGPAPHFTALDFLPETCEVVKYDPYRDIPGQPIFFGDK